MTPQISVVTPTYREAENLPALVEKISAHLADVPHEIIVADDDSADGTPEVCERLSRRYCVRLLSRIADRGLSPAVMDGIDIARGDIVVVMDADLSHPPEAVKPMAKLLQDGAADFVIGSRYAGGDVDRRWPWWRRLNSRAATWPARLLTAVADPMSGFFAFRRADMPRRENLSPIGYKIGLEILVKIGCDRARVREVPIYFRQRRLGTSKMTLMQQINYLRHLRRLYHYCWPKQMEIIQFCFVGATGLVWDIAFYYFFQFAGLPHLFARAAAFLPAVTNNWFLNRVMTFKTRARAPMIGQWAAFVASSAVGLAVNWGVYALLTVYTEYFMHNPFLAFLVGVGAGTTVNFFGSDKIVFRPAAKKTSSRRA